MEGTHLFGASLIVPKNRVIPRRWCSAQRIMIYNDRQWRSYHNSTKPDVGISCSLERLYRKSLDFSQF